MSESATTTRTVTYRCPSCNALVEADRRDWADWRVCPDCDTPCRLPEPEISRARSTAGTMYIGPEGSARVVTTPGSRMSWLDAVVPPQGTTARSAESSPASLFPSSVPVVEPAAPTPSNGTPEPTNPSPAPPIPKPSSRPNPTPEQLAAAFARPARVMNAPRPIRRATRSKRGRIFLGLCLCVSLTALIFQIASPQTEYAAVWAIAALVSFIMLVRAPRRY